MDNTIGIDGNRVVIHAAMPNVYVINIKYQIGDAIIYNHIIRDIHGKFTVKDLVEIMDGINTGIAFKLYGVRAQVKSVQKTDRSFRTYSNK